MAKFLHYDAFVEQTKQTAKERSIEITENQIRACIVELESMYDANTAHTTITGRQLRPEQVMTGSFIAGVLFALDKFKNGTCDLHYKDGKFEKAVNNDETD